MTVVNDNRRIEDNIVLPFQLESSNLRGRIVRFGDTIDGILSAHKYPQKVTKLTGEMLVLASLLSSMLKYEGVFTLQAQGNGSVRMAVADMTSGGGVRACAAFKDDEAAIHEGDGDATSALLGEGHMAFTVDQGDHSERYQGIVALDPSSLIGSIQNYFMQSEQVMTGIVIAVGQVDGRWRGSGIMVQQMPEETTHYNAETSNHDEDGWRRAMILLESVKEEELLSRDISADDILYRLFHEEGVRVFPSKALKNVCRCNPDRVRRILESMPKQDILDLVDDGRITMTCEFCSREYVFEPEEFLKGAQT